MNESELFEIFGELIDSEIVQSFLKKYPSFKEEKPESGRQYIISKELGIDLIFEPDEGIQGGKTKHLRKCQSVFLYKQGKDGHEQYKGFIPYSFDFADSRNELIKKQKPERTWKIGEGEVDLSHPNPNHDRWKYSNYHIAAHYSKKTGETMYFAISRIRA